MSENTRTYLTIRATVRAAFWTTLAATPYLLAGAINATTCTLAGNPAILPACQ